MKKLWITLAAVALVAALCATGALAAGRHSRWNTGVNGGSVCSAACFTDADGDGVCDYRGTNCGRYFTDADGDGICDCFGTGLGGHHGGRGGCRNH